MGSSIFVTFETTTSAERFGREARSSGRYEGPSFNCAVETDSGADVILPLLDSDVLLSEVIVIVTNEPRPSFGPNSSEEVAFCKAVSRFVETLPSTSI